MFGLGIGIQVCGGDLIGIGEHGGGFSLPVCAVFGWRIVPLRFSSDRRIVAYASEVKKGFTQVLYACVGLSIESIDIPILKIDEQVGCVHFTIAAPQAENVFDEVDWTQSLFPQGHGFER